MKTYLSYVYAPGFGSDTYLVCARDRKDAEKETLKRLDEETDIPLDRWEIVEIVEAN